jgi:hypothetical protein
MSRTGIHQDAMLRHLGAAYYESLHGWALPTDVTPAHASTVHPAACPSSTPTGSSSAW